MEKSVEKKCLYSKFGEEDEDPATTKNVYKKNECAD